MAAPGVTLITSFPYRGHDEEWSNQYHFVGDAPSDDTGWMALVDELTNLVKLAIGGQDTIVRAYCYEDTDDDSVFTYDLVAHGTERTGGQNCGDGEMFAPGDSAAWIRWKTARLNTNGKPIYLRKYYHGVCLTSVDGESDTIAAHQVTALRTLATALNTAGTDWPGIAGPDGVAPGLSTSSSFVTTRTLKRRGPRPH